MTSEAIRLRRNELSCEGASGSGPSRLKSKRPPRDSVAGVFLASRLARVLVKFSQQYGVQTETGVRIDLPVTHQDLANMIGTARETVSRNMARFRQKGYVRDASTGQPLELLDLGSLERLIV